MTSRDSSGLHPLSKDQLPGGASLLHPTALGNPRPGLRRLAGLRGSLVLTACLLGFVFPAKAQERLVTPGPIARAVAKEAVPLAARDGAVGTQQVSAESDWQHVKRLVAGDRVRVHLDDSASREGIFRGADDRSMTIQLHGRDQQLSRAGVRHVSVARGSHRRRHVLVGLVIGGAASAVAVGLSCRGQDASCKEAAPAYFYPLAGAGAAVGALLPARVWREIY